MKPRAAIRIAVLVFLASGINVLADPPYQAPETQDRSSVSPDKKWEYQPHEDEPKIIKAGTDQVAVPFSDECNGGGCGYATVLWAPESRRFAFYYGQGREHQSSLYQLDDEEWRAIKAPSDSDEILTVVDHAIRIQAKRKGLARNMLRHIEYTVQVYRWADASTAIVYAVDREQDKTGDLFFWAGFVFTLKFDHSGNWRIAKTSRMSDNEIGRFESYK
jgi:hypothetical protein